MVYQGLDTILPKKELTLELIEKPSWLELFWVKSRVYPCNFIENGLQLGGFPPLVLKDGSF